MQQQLDNASDRMRGTGAQLENEAKPLRDEVTQDASIDAVEEKRGRHAENNSYDIRQESTKPGRNDTEAAKSAYVNPLGILYADGDDRTCYL